MNCDRRMTRCLIIFSITTTGLVSWMISPLSTQSLGLSVYAPEISMAVATPPIGIGKINSIEIRKPLLTLFTTFKDLPEKKFIHNNTIMNWALLYPDVVPVLIVTNLSAELGNASSSARFANNHGWHVVECNRTTNGIPIFKSMFLDVAKLGFQSTFIGYANGDILFGKNLVKTLEAVKLFEPNISSKITFISGLRTNINADRLEALKHPHNVEEITHALGHIHPYIAGSADYFIFTEAGFNWSHVPDFVIGHVAYDNWILAKAVEWGIWQLDASRTVVAVHQTGLDGNLAGVKNNYDNYINLNLARKNKYHAKLSRQFLASFISYFDVSAGEIRIKKTTYPVKHYIVANHLENVISDQLNSF